MGDSTTMGTWNKSIPLLAAIALVTSAAINEFVMDDCPTNFLGNDTMPCWSLDGSCYCFASIKVGD